MSTPQDPMLDETRHEEWRLFPYGWWLDADGNAFLFDRDYCPLVAKAPNGTLAITPSDTFVLHVKQKWLHDGYLAAPTVSMATRHKVLGVVERTGIRPEIERRRELVKRTRSRLLRYNDPGARGKAGVENDVL